MNKLLLFWLSIPLLAACSPNSTLPERVQSDADLIIQNVTTIDAVSGERPNMDVAIASDRIVSVKPSGGKATATGTNIIDGTDKFLIPGLWDAHVHLAYDSEIGHESFFPLALAHGVTYLRDTGGHLDKLTEARALASSDKVTPDLYVSGPLVDGEKRVYAGQSATTPNLSIGVATREQAIAEVDRLAAQDVNFIKAYEMLAPDVFRAVVLQAKKHDLPVTAHSPLSMTAGQAIEAGISDMQHLRNLEMDCVADPEMLLQQRETVMAANEAEYGGKLRSEIHRLQRHKAVQARNAESCKTLIALMKSKGVSQTPTLTISRFLSRKLYADKNWQDTFQMMPPTVAQKWTQIASRLASRKPTTSDKAYDDWLMTMVSDLNQAGISILAGTDAPIGFLTPGASLHEELIMLVEAGLTPLEAIRAATIAPAAFFNLQDSQGSVAPKMQADLVLLTKNPLTDIQNIKDIDLVIKDGQVVAVPTRKELYRNMD
ncbi:MAG: amidohydrolase family protein [Parasphingorhabdus sp.]